MSFCKHKIESSKVKKACLLLCDVLLAECSRRLEERDSMIGQLQRSKAGVCQNYEDLKRQLEEESKVTLKP